MSDTNWLEHIERLREVAETIRPAMSHTSPVDSLICYATTLLALERAERWESLERHNQELPLIKFWLEDKMKSPLDRIAIRDVLTAVEDIGAQISKDEEYAAIHEPLPKFLREPPEAPDDPI